MRKVTQELVNEVLDEIVDNTYYLLTCQKTFDDLLRDNTSDFPVMFLVEPNQDFEARRNARAAKGYGILQPL